MNVKLTSIDLSGEWNRNHILKITNWVLGMEQEIIKEMYRLLEKTGIENLVPVHVASQEPSDQLFETTLINLRSFNARYEKSEALNQVQWLMNTYNIQIDELMERIR